MGVSESKIADAALARASLASDARLATRRHVPYQGRTVAPEFRVAQVPGVSEMKCTRCGRSDTEVGKKGALAGYCIRCQQFGRNRLKRDDLAANPATIATFLASAPASPPSQSSSTPSQSLSQAAPPGPPGPADSGERAPSQDSSIAPSQSSSTPSQEDVLDQLGPFAPQSFGCPAWVFDTRRRTRRKKVRPALEYMAIPGRPLSPACCKM